MSDLNPNHQSHGGEKPAGEPQRDTPQLTDAMRDRCVEYLLGGLDAEQTQAFEISLAHSPALAVALGELSETISMVSLAANTNSFAVDSATASASDSATSQIPTTTYSVSTAFSAWKVFGVAAALAACLLVAFNWPHQESATATADQESLLIAQAWATGSLDPLGESESVIEQLDLEMDELNNNQLPPRDDDWATNTSEEDSLTWMITAIEAGDSNDG